MNTSGYIYCFSNPSFNGILKIGMTTRYIERRLVEANHCGTWGPPTPYKIEFAKKVANPLEKETILHMLLEKYSERVNANREFFRISVEDVRLFFDLIDGDYWNELDRPIEEKEDIIENHIDFDKLLPIQNGNYTQLNNSNRTAVNYSTKLPVTDLNGAPQRGVDSNLHGYKYFCKTCCIQTNNKQTYYRHILSDRHKQFQKFNYSKYVCTTCNKKYNSHVGLYKHCKKCSNNTDENIMVEKVKLLFDTINNEKNGV